MITVRSQVQKESVAPVAGAIERMLSALKHERPQGIRFTPCKLPDGETFVALLEREEGGDNPWPGLAAADACRESLKNRVVEPPIRDELEGVGSSRASR
jgi:hypothetical protein